MTSLHWRTFIVLLSGIFLAAAIVRSLVPAQPVQSFATFKLTGKEKNPDAFYLCATGRAISYGFIYDPHAADDWMFQTAEGSMEQLSQKIVGFDK